MRSQRAHTKYLHVLINYDSRLLQEFRLFKTRINTVTISGFTQAVI